MRIGELARASGATVRMIRYYDAQGLLSPARERNGYRQFTEADVSTVIDIRCLLDGGLRLVEVRHVLLVACGEADPGSSEDDVQGAIERIDERMRSVEAGQRKLRSEKKTLDRLRDEIAARNLAVR